MTQAADLAEYQELVTEALKGSGVKQGAAAERLCHVFLPSELAEVVAKNDLNTLMQRSGFDEDRSKKILNALRSGGTHYTIETVALDDQPSIELLDGDTFKESTHLSTGQRCTTILPILLTQSERPLLIDQPEDNLDNAFVYETIVRALRTIKGSRQVIFVTHNPNIPVLGEAERVFVFSSDGQHSTLKQVGTVDECREQIERILEGGREAFLLEESSLWPLTRTLWHRELLAALDAPDWSVTLQAVAAADTRIRGSIVGDPKVEEIVAKLVALASHTKWEVRRAVANAAAHAPHPIFESVLAKLALDDNSRVRQAAEHAALRRRDSRHASTLGKQHEDRINSILDDIEARFGLRGRDAVKRAAEQIANTFARELYHEVIKLLSPLAASADRLRAQLSAANVPAEALAEEADRIGRRVTQLRAVLDAMRAYTAQPTLSFKTEVLQEVIQEAASVALESDRRQIATAVNRH